MLAVERRLIDLEVPGMNHDPLRRLDRERDTVRDAVRDAQELDRERADRHAIARPDSHQPVRDLVSALLELRLDQRKGQRCAVDGPLNVRQHVRDRANVILVPVRQHERGEPVLLQLAQIRDDQIDAEQLGLREHHAGIDDDGRLATGDDHHVHAELANAAERNRSRAAAPRPTRVRRESSA